MVRIVSLLPSATEIVGALGLTEALVGVSHECDYPPAVQRLPRLTRSLLPEGATPAEIDALVVRALHEHRALYALDLDLLERLRPDLILTQELCAVCAVAYDEVLRAARRLRGGGGQPTIVSLEPQTIDDILESIRVVAQSAGVPERAEPVVAGLRQRLERVRARTASLTARPRVLVLEWPDPPYVGGHWVPEMVLLAGGTNVPLQQERLGRPSVRVTWETLQAQDPDLIVIAPCGYHLAQAVAAGHDLARRPEWAALRAVQAGEVWAVDANSYFSRPGPRVVDGVELLAAIIATRPPTVGQPPQAQRLPPVGAPSATPTG